MKPQLHSPPILEIPTPASNVYSRGELFLLSLRCFEVAYLCGVSAGLIDRFLDNWQINKHVKGLLGLLTVAPLSVTSLIAGFLGVLTFCLVFGEDEISRDA